MDSNRDSVYARICDTPHVLRLSKQNLGYLQVVLSEFSLHRRDRGKHLEVRIPNDPQVIRSGDGKRTIEHEARAPRTSGLKSLERELAEFEENGLVTSRVIDCANWPMRFANGGVLPVVQLGGKDYFLMFYRDIFPVGWNIANGASDDTDEWLDPTRIIQREFGEEVLFCDPTAKRLFIHDPPGPARSFGFHDEAIATWTERWLEIERFERTPMPLKWIEGPDSVTVTFRGRTESHHGVFLSVTPEDHGIEVDRVALIRLNGNIRVLDGEGFNGKLFNHVVGLFEVQSFFKQLKGQTFKPDRVFHDGKEFNPDQLQKVIDSYLSQVRKDRLRSSKQVADFERTRRRFNLCPISRAVAERYQRWLNKDPRGEGNSVRGMPSTLDHERADVFISHRSTNVQHARALHDFLEQRGHRVFFSDETLAKRGESDYARTIGQALDQARVLILLAMAPEDFHSGWVDYEWKAFHNELLSGRKKGEIFSLLSNVSIDQLPLLLRSRQSVPYQPNMQFDSFHNLYRFVSRALEATATV